MDALLPRDLSVLPKLLAVLVALLALGMLGPRLPLAPARALGWSLGIASVLAADALTRGEPAGLRMLALIAAGLLAMKVLVVIEECARGMARPSLGTWFAFACLWAGMRPRLFVEAADPDPGGARPLLFRGAAFLAGGLGAIALARPLADATGSLLAGTALALVGLSWALHFGILNLTAGFWRSRGVACEALFRAPLLAENLGEFWSRRWNIAFSEMTATAVYRPLSRALGRTPALLAAFLLSGLLHEMAISLPVRAGFGGPMVYFLLHGLLVRIERALAARDRALAGAVGRVWMLAWLVLPLPLLFHRPFLGQVVAPIARLPF